MEDDGRNWQWSGFEGGELQQSEDQQYVDARMPRARVNRVAALLAGGGLVLGGLLLLRLSRLAASKGALFVVVGVLLIIVAIWPVGTRSG